MSQKILAFSKTKKLGLRASISRYSMIKEYAAVNEMSLSDVINSGLDKLFEETPKKEDDNPTQIYKALEHIFKAMNDLNDKINELSAQLEVKN